MRKRLSAALLVALALLFSGCAGQTGTDAKTAGPAEPAGFVAEAPGTERPGREGDVPVGELSAGTERPGDKADASAGTEQPEREGGAPAGAESPEREGDVSAGESPEREADASAGESPEREGDAPAGESPEAEGAAADAVEYTFRNERLLQSHYEKHGIEMGFSSPEEYEAAACAVISHPDALHKLEAEDGDDVYYVEATNEFVIVSVDGYIRTYFYPNAGIDYYNRQ